MSQGTREAGKQPGQRGEALLEVRGLCIEGESDEVRVKIVKSIDLTLRRGEVLGLIGESGWRPWALPVRAASSRPAAWFSTASTS